jgi:hypothetical protein
MSINENYEFNVVHYYVQIVFISDRQYAQLFFIYIYIYTHFLQVL